MEILQESEDDTGFDWFPEEEGGQDLPADELEKSNNEVRLAKQAAWALRCFQTWLITKNLKIDLKSVSKKELGVVLRQWYGSIRTSKGEQYSLASYQSLRSGFSRYINDPPISRSWNLIQDPEFASANIVFKRVAGELRRATKGRGTSFPPISPEDQRILKHSKTLNPDNPLGLLNKVWFDIQLHFGHIGKGYRDHKPDSFTLKCDEYGAKYFTMTSNEETAPLDRKHGGAVMYEERGCPLCPVLSLEKYLKKIPPNATSLYLKPIRYLYKTDTYWYTSVPMSGKDLLQMLPSICKEAGTRLYTYRHLTATSKQIILHAGFESREVAVEGDRMKQLPSRSASSGTKDKMIRLSKSEMRAMVEQEIQRTIKENEARLQVLIDTFEQLESGVDYERSIQKLEARINIVAKKAEAALGCIMKTEKKNPPSSLVKVNIKNEIERTVPEDKSADSVEKDADLFQLMDNTRKALKKMHSENQAVKAAIAGLGRTEELPPPVLTPHGSPNFKGQASFIKKELEDTPEKRNAEEQEQIEEPKAKRVKVECLSANQSYSPKARNIKVEQSYPPLPSIPFPSVLSMEAASYNIPPRPEVQVALIRDPPGLSVLWKLEKEDPCAAPMDSYRVYMTSEKVSGSDSFSDWIIVGEVRAIQLPIGVMIDKYKSGCKTCIAVVGKDKFNRFGPFSKVVPVYIPN